MLLHFKMKTKQDVPFVLHDERYNAVKAVSVCSSYLIEENILPVCPFSSKLLNNPLRTDAMLCTQLLPKLKTNCNTQTEEQVSKRLAYIS